MQLRNLLSDDDAVSPVIGVILMVAITVILAAVIGSFLLSLGENQSVPPQAAFDADEEKITGDASKDAVVTFTHAGGDLIPSASSRVSVSSSDANVVSTDISGNGNDELVAGNTVTVELDGTSEGDDVRLGYNSPDDQSVTLKVFTLNENYS